MKDYDEYQKIMRYKYGYYSFILLLALLLLNEFIMTSPDPQWGETNGLETLFIIGIVLFIFNIATIYHNAYFSKRENVAWYLLFDVLMSAFYIFILFSNKVGFPDNLFIEGKLSFNSFNLLIGLIFLTRPITYLIRKGIDKFRDKE